MRTPNSPSRKLSHWLFVSSRCPLVSSSPMEMISQSMGNGDWGLGTGGWGTCKRNEDWSLRVRYYNSLKSLCLFRPLQSPVPSLQPLSRRIRAHQPSDRAADEHGAHA